MNHQEGHFKGKKDIELYYQAWLPDGKPTAVLLVAHGMAEHGGRYGNLVEYLVPKGYAIYINDHRGHGRSQGQRAYVERFTYYLDDLKAFFDIVRGQHPDTKIFLLGHSMGGTIGVAYTLQHQDELAGLILSAPSVKAGESISPLLVVMVKTISVLLPKMGTIVLDASAISSDPAVVQAYDNDPLVYRGKVSARLGAELLKTTQSSAERIHQLALPVLIMQGSADRLCDPEGSQWLYDQTRSADKTLHFYEGFFHEVLNEPERERALSDLESWLSDHA